MKKFLFGGLGIFFFLAFLNIFKWFDGNVSYHARKDHAYSIIAKLIKASQAFYTEFGVMPNSTFDLGQYASIKGCDKLTSSICNQENVIDYKDHIKKRWFITNGNYEIQINSNDNKITFYANPSGKNFGGYPIYGFYNSLNGGIFLDYNPKKGKRFDFDLLNKKNNEATEEDLEQDLIKILNSEIKEDSPISYLDISLYTKDNKFVSNIFTNINGCILEKPYRGIYEYLGDRFGREALCKSNNLKVHEIEITNKFKNLWFSPYGTYKIMAKTSGPYIISIIIPSSKKSNMINGFWKISHRFLSTKNSGILSKDIYKKFSKTYSGKNGFIPDLSNNQINLDNCYMDYLEMESVSLKETKLNECGVLKFRMQIKEDLRRNFL